MAEIKKKKTLKKLVKKTTKKPVAKITKRVAKPRLKKLHKKLSPLDLEKSIHNPIITPQDHAYWESKATFNPSAIFADGVFHIVYRAIGENDTSVIGYASSHDGITIDERSTHPIYIHHSDHFAKISPHPILYGSGGGWNGGSEDPRLTLLNDRVYMTYTAFDGWGSVRIALTSISLEDFLAKQWDWKEPVLISTPGQLHKNWVLFPKKIHGKFAILHGISPEIMIDYFDTLDELDGHTFIESIHQDDPRWQFRDKGIRGVGPAPLDTKYGWLVLYHAMDKDNPNQYKLWAMILDHDNPTKILYKGTEPILEPDQLYENEGFKSGIVYSCGAIIKGKKLFVYYGGADTVTCVATANLDNFLKELITTGAPIIRKRKSKTI